MATQTTQPSKADFPVKIAESATERKLNQFVSCTNGGRKDERFETELKSDSDNLT